MKGNQITKRLLGKSTLFLKKHSSTILTVVGAVGVVATAVLAVKATPKALELLEHAEEEKGDELTKTETVCVAGPVYIPAAVVGVSTIACIFGANVLNKRQQAALMSAYALADNAYKEYRNKTKELFGEEADIRIRDEIVKDNRDKSIHAYAPGCNSISLTGEECLFYDEYREEYFEATMNEVLNAEYHLNRNLALRGHVLLNEFYGFLGMSETKYGDTFGWSAEEFLEGGVMPWIDFDHRLVQLADGLECYVINTIFEPVDLVDYL